MDIVFINIHFGIMKSFFIYVNTDRSYFDIKLLEQISFVSMATSESSTWLFCYGGLSYRLGTEKHLCAPVEHLVNYIIILS